MYCFDANSKAVSYANKLFKINNLNLTALNIGLGDGKKNVFFVNDDYLLALLTNLIKRILKL